MIVEHVTGELVSPTEQDVPQIRALQEFMSQITSSLPQLVAADGGMIAVPESVYHALRRIVPLMAQGATIGLIPLHKELTTQEAANLLNVSRPFLVKLLDEGVIPSTRPNKHRRVRLNDVIAYKEARSAVRRAALDDLTALAEDYGDYD